MIASEHGIPSRTFSSLCWANRRKFMACGMQLPYF
jgi:hypothetical protein